MPLSTADKGVGAFGKMLIDLRNDIGLLRHKLRQMPLLLGWLKRPKNYPPV